MVAAVHGHQPISVVRRAELLYAAAKDVVHSDLSIGGLADGVRGRGLAAWVRPHLEDDSPENIRAVARTFLRSAVDEALMGPPVRGSH